MPKTSRQQKPIRKRYLLTLVYAPLPKLANVLVREERKPPFFAGALMAQTYFSQLHRVKH